ncbi:hypothetical protein MMC14_006287 [Varicellaria rhodocarpa]|nr:hypothetical protein [Varicellaria rhodocarpa]
MKLSLCSLIVLFGISVSPVLSEISINHAVGRIQRQNPIIPIPNIALPSPDSSIPEMSSDLSISDVIGKERIINIFAGFTRDIESISKRFDAPTQNTTVLAPLNSEIQKLPRKPWENPKDYETLGASAYEGSGGEDRAHQNLRRFVEAHVVPVSPWEEGTKVESIGGGIVWWETKDDKKIIQPGNIEVSSVISRVANGEVWVVKGVLNYE